MSISISSLERDNPPPRRKACQACIRAKRRCDLGSPSCLRCSHRQINCTYDVCRGGTPSTRPRLNSKRQQQTRAVAAIPAADHTTDCFLDVAMDMSAPLLPEGPSLFMDPEPPTAFTASKDCLFTFDDPLDDALLTGNLLFQDDAAAATATTTTLEPYQQQQQQQPSPGHPMPRFLRDPTESRFTTHRCIPLNPGELSHIVRVRLSYALSTLQRAPSDFVESTGTAWASPALFRNGMTPIVEDVHAACALYRARNPHNKAVIMRSIENRLARLLRDRPRQPLTVLEALYRAHALLLYQIMRMLDDDLASRIDNHATIDALEEAMETLKAHLIFQAGATDSSYDYETYDLVRECMAECLEVEAPSSSPAEPETPASLPAKLPLYPLGVARSFWDRWTLEESTRRTFLAAFFMSQMARIISGSPLAKCLGRNTSWNCWTMAADLWHAPGPAEFASAWNRWLDARGEPTLVRTGGLAAALSKAVPEDMDDFARLVTISTLGIDEVKAWFASKGGVF